MTSLWEKVVAHEEHNPTANTARLDNATVRKATALKGGASTSSNEAVKATNLVGELEDATTWGTKESRVKQVATPEDLTIDVGP